MRVVPSRPQVGSLPPNIAFDLDRLSAMTLSWTKKIGLLLFNARFIQQRSNLLAEIGFICAIHFGRNLERDPDRLCYLGRAINALFR